MKNKSKTVALLGACTAVALVLAYLEAMLPPLFPAVPGIKMGLPNIILVFLLYRRGPAFASVVSLLRVLLITLLFGNAMMLLYSLAGGALSMLLMWLLSRSKGFSPVGVSVAGGVAHNIGQVLMAMLLLETPQLGYYLVVLTVTGTAAGILVGLAGALLIKKVPKL
ncbi:MAG: Gx transporter family protein [Clostridia bacterium]|nr:Gx transporter family protein [Clostridia bacterium]